MNAADGYRVALLDWLACAIGGAAEPAAIAAAGAGDGLLERVAAAGTAGHVLDFDDTYLPGVAHLSAATAPAALVLGAELGASVEEALAAYAAGFEAMGAFAGAAHPDLYDGGWHPTSVCGGVGAAVVASRLLGLDAAGEESASALALLRASGFRSAFGSAGKGIQVGMAAAEGVAAARVAAAGAESACRRWRPDTQDSRPPSAGLSGAGRRVQPRRSSRTGSRPIPAAFRPTARSRRPPRCARPAAPPARTIEISVHPLSLQAAPITIPGNGLEAKFSIPYLAAFTLLHGPPGLESFAEVDADAARLAAAIEVRAEPDLDESEAVLALDAEQVSRVPAALGSPQRPLDPAGLSAKRRALAGERLEGALDDADRPVAELAELIGRR